MTEKENLCHPKVLLLGHGPCRSCGGVSWNEFLRMLARKEEIQSGKCSVESLNCPEPLKAILVTDDHVDVALKDYWEAYQPKIEGDISLFQNILSSGFDDILTTNYTYELEQVALFPGKISKSKIKAMMRHTEGSKKAEGKYLLHTYNEVVVNGHQNRIWHIHGEARKPDSTILGHYYYGNLLCKIKEELSKRRYDKACECKSWIDSFVLGDVYILGFGFGLSEFDLWWLLNRKAREKTKVGKVYFYEPEPAGFSEKQELLRLLRCTSNGEPLVHIRNCGFRNEMILTAENEKIERLAGNYEDFYRTALEDIRKTMVERTKTL